MSVGVRWRWGELLFGPDYHKEGDKYDGLLNIAPYGKEVLMGGMGSAEFSRAQHDEILEYLSTLGYETAKELRNSKWWIYDLTQRPFKRVKI